LDSKGKNSALEKENDWANDLTGEPIHIFNAASGLKGYYCMGCEKEMQAVKFKNPNFQSYFRHHAHDINKDNVECVFSSRVYRERLAEQILRRLKELKLPELYKYPPTGVIGNPILLAKKTTIQAASVISQLSFYEDENGEVKWGKNPEIDDRYLLIRPDVTFFDKEDKPILFVEFVITHKIPDDKKVKLKRLGINTVQIIIPKVPEEEIEKCLKSVAKVKWVYNEIESNTEYIPVLEGNSEGIPFIDEEQRKLFEESYSCRAAQVSNLIRSISRCVESESYKRVEFQFEQEISRIKDATKEHQSRWDAIQAGIENKVRSELESRREKLAERRRKLAERRRKLGERDSDLEARYLKRRGEIKQEQANTDREIKFRYRAGISEENIRREFGVEEKRIDDDQKIVSRQEGYIDSDTREESRFADNFESRKAELGNEFRNLEKDEQEKFRKFERAEQEDFNELKRRVEPENEGHRTQQVEIENELRSEFERRYEQIADRISERDVRERDELSGRIKTILELRGLLDNYGNEKSTLEKYRKGISNIKNGTWKD
jgi:hypothetical protein